MFIFLMSLFEPLVAYMHNPDVVKKESPTLKEQAKIKYKQVCEHCMRELPNG